MADVQKRYVKLTLVSPDDADVLAIVNRLAHCGRLAQTVIAALRAYSADPVARQEVHSGAFEPVAESLPIQSVQSPVDESVFAFN